MHQSTQSSMPSRTPAAIHWQLLLVINWKAVCACKISIIYRIWLVESKTQISHLVSLVPGLSPPPHTCPACRSRFWGIHGIGNNPDRGPPELSDFRKGCERPAQLAEPLLALAAQLPSCPTAQAVWLPGPSSRKESLQDVHPAGRIPYPTLPYPTLPYSTCCISHIAIL